MNEFIAELINDFSFTFNTITERNWFEIASILTPTVLLICALLGLSFSLKGKKWKITVYLVCSLLALIFLPYELLRQSDEMSKADANIKAMQTNLKDMLRAADLGHLENLSNKEVATDVLQQMISDFNKEQKKELLFISLLLTENEKKSLHYFNDKQESFAEEIKSKLNNAKSEIIDTREPIEKISDNIRKRLDQDISQLIEGKMSAFNKEIDKSLDNFQQELKIFVQNELQEYEQILTAITQKNAVELKNYTQKAKQAFAYQVNRSTKESLKKLDEAQKSIDNMESTIENINLKKVATQVDGLSSSIDLIKKKNDLLFEYSECLRSAGFFDFSGKEAQCKTKLEKDMKGLM